MTHHVLLKKLSELDFMAVDLALYLDTHPDDELVIAQYNKIIIAADAVRSKYEELYGPLCSFRSLNPSQNSWQWTNDPWPWNRSFNLTICEGGKN